MSQKGWKGPSTPEGSIENPFNAISLMVQAGASFVARSFAGELEHLTDTFVKGLEHEGFSFIEVLQPAVPYHTWKEYRDKIRFLKKQPESFEEALITANRENAYTLGIFYEILKPIYHKELYGDHNPIYNRLSREERLSKIRKILETI